MSGIQSLVSFNLALPGKWWWFVVEQERLWRKVVGPKYRLGWGSDIQVRCDSHMDGVCGRVSVGGSFGRGLAFGLGWGFGSGFGRMSGVE